MKKKRRTVKTLHCDQIAELQGRRFLWKDWSIEDSIQIAVCASDSWANRALRLVGSDAVFSLRVEYCCLQETRSAIRDSMVFELFLENYLEVAPLSQGLMAIVMKIRRLRIPLRMPHLLALDHFPNSCHRQTQNSKTYYCSQSPENLNWCAVFGDMHRLSRQTPAKP